MTEQRDLIDFEDDPELGVLLDRVGAENVPADRWPQTLADIVDVTAAALEGRGMAAGESRDTARAVAVALADYLGARPIYLPRGDTLRTAIEHAAIWHNWDGRSATKYALARQYRTTPRNIERIIVEQRTLHRRRFQGSLFPNEEQS